MNCSRSFYFFMYTFCSFGYISLCVPAPINFRRRVVGLCVLFFSASILRCFLVRSTPFICMTFLAAITKRFLAGFMFCSILLADVILMKLCTMLDTFSALPQATRSASWLMLTSSSFALTSSALLLRRCVTLTGTRDSGKSLSKGSLSLESLLSEWKSSWCQCFFPRSGLSNLACYMASYSGAKI